MPPPPWLAERAGACGQKVARCSSPPLSESVGAFETYTNSHGASFSPNVRRRRAGLPATTVREATLLVTTAPAPTIVTPSQMNEWLEILQRAPTIAFF